MTVLTPTHVFTALTKRARNTQIEYELFFPICYPRANIDDALWLDRDECC